MRSYVHGYDYKVIELPANLSGKAGGSGEAAKALQDVISTHAVEGFEFHRVDSFGGQRPAGCLSGGNVQATSYNVVTFRRQRP